MKVTNYKSEKVIVVKNNTPFLDGNILSNEEFDVLKFKLDVMYI